MKRTGLSLIAVMVMSLALAPVGLGGSGLRANEALAAPAPAAGGNILQSSPTVCVAVPVLAKQSKQGGCLAGEEEISNAPGSGGAIIFYLKEILKLFNGLIGGIIILVLVLAGVQYIASVGDPTRVKDAKKRVSNAITALVLYLLMFAILNFLIPGGILP